MPESSERDAIVARNYREILERVADAARRSGRDPMEICVVGVTKYVDAQTAGALVRAGCRDLGESRPQSLWQKAESMPGDIAWHLIGHLQRNKVRRTLPWLSLLHSLDSERLAAQIENDAQDLGLVPRVLLEINLTQDVSKTGMSIESAERWLENYARDRTRQTRFELSGLMGMSSLDGDDARTRAEFASLRQCLERWNREFGLRLKILSMGMSDDFEIAIEEGATIVRIGSRLFQGVV